MKLFRATVMDTPVDPFTAGPADALVADQDAALVVRDGVIIARGAYDVVRSRYPAEAAVDLTAGVLLPGFVDTHVHFPQVRAIGGLGRPLLAWLEQCALPEESRLADPDYAAAVAEDFLNGLVAAGTTSALVFGAHFGTAMDLLFAGAEHRGLNITSGLVLSDRILRPSLLVTPEQGLAASRELVDRWHGRGRLKYAVTPRFSLSTTDAMLEVCAELLTGDLWFTSHLNENHAEIAAVAEFFPRSAHYLDTYAQHGLVTSRSIFAHNVHPAPAELELMAAQGAWASHCPTSNASLGSGMFPLREHLDAGVGVALGSDVGAGTGFFLPKEGLQAYFVQQLLGRQGLPLTPAHLLYLATRAGALALGIADRVGDLAVGKEFDAVWLRPPDGGPLAVNIANAADPADALARIFALATPADVAGVWTCGRRISGAAPA